MSSQVTNKLEINLLNANTSPQYVSEFVIKHRIPAIVASPEYIAPLTAHKAIMGGKYKLICALDFPKGSNFAMDKLFRANPDFVVADGFDILLSTGRSEIELRNEMKTIYSYLKANRPLCDIRWCLNMNSATNMNEIIGVLKGMQKFPPSMIRIDPHLDLPNAKLERLKEHVELIKEHVPYPIKLSGNIGLEALAAFGDERRVKRFDVSMAQADTIVKKLKIEAQVNIPPAEPPKTKGPAVKRTGPRINI